MQWLYKALKILMNYHETVVYLRLRSKAGCACEQPSVGQRTVAGEGPNLGRLDCCRRQCVGPETDMIATRS